MLLANPAFFFFCLIPLMLTAWNVYALVSFLLTGQASKKNAFFEVILVAVGICGLLVYVVFADVTTAEWYTQLYHSQKHFFLSSERLPVFYVLLAVAVLGYVVLRYLPTAKLPPLVVAFGIAGAYIGVALSVVFSIQIFPHLPMILVAFNFALLWIKAVCRVVKQRNIQLQNGVHRTRFKKLSGLLNTWAGLPLLGFLALIPLMGIVLVILTLFGQQPSDLIKLWTETADWTLSQKIPPQNIAYDEHYLCTVAAGGHRKVVKPLRTGVRHGHRVVVNRQLCVANAFEDVIQQRTPRFHKVVRAVYDHTGYPIAKHIRSPYVADIIYCLMKPLEWCFLLFLYATCAHPEDRIAVQYPHSQPPKMT